SAVAVCCSKASRVSVKSRAFSIAITACAAKFSNNAICLSENGRTSCRGAGGLAEKRVSFSGGSGYKINRRSRSYRCWRHWVVDVRQIGDVNKTLPGQQWLAPWGFGRSESLSQPDGGWLGYAAHCDSAKVLAIIESQAPHGSVAQAVRLLQYRVEDRDEIAGRGIDDLQHLRGRGLLLQCLARLGQQPRVFHCNDRLRREILQQRNLLVAN